MFKPKLGTAHTARNRQTMIFSATLTGDGSIKQNRVKTRKTTLFGKKNINSR